MHSNIERRPFAFLGEREKRGTCRYCISQAACALLQRQKQALSQCAMIRDGSPDGTVFVIIMTGGSTEGSLRALPETVSLSLSLHRQ